MGKGKEGRHVRLYHWFLSSPAWQGLPPESQALYIQIAVRYNGSNNGRISYAVREAAQALRKHRDTARRYLKILEERGFIVCTKRGNFNNRDASEWRLTEFAADFPTPQHATKTCG